MATYVAEMAAPEHEESLRCPAPASSRDESVAEALVRELCSAGMDMFFGVPGGPVISVFHRVLLEPRARLVESRHETTAVFGAMGLHRATGRAGVVVVTAGPGATNVVTGVAAAHFERVPLVVVCGDVASDGRRLAQDLSFDGHGGLEELFAPFARKVERVRRPEAAWEQLAAIMRAATDPVRPGPAVLIVPVDRADARVRGRGQRSRIVLAPARRPTHDTSMPSEVAARLRAAERPLVVIGAGCRGHEREVRGMVDALGVPAMTTPQAKGLLPEDHPLSLRNGGMSASWWARRYTASAPDLALVLGTDLDDTSTAGTPVVGKGGEVVHVDLDDRVFGRNFRTEIAARADLGPFAAALADVATPHPRGAELVAAARSSSPFDTPAFREDEGAPIRPHRVIADLERAAHASARFVSDIGEHMLFALHYLTAREPDRLTIHLGLGSMGSGIGSAIGLALGDPSRPVICICGDGGMQMAGAELLVAIRERLPIVFAVLNDARYNMVFHGYRLTHGREAPWSTPPMDFVAWAGSLGAAARRIDAAGEITRELLDGLTRNGPAVLDIRQDRDVRIRGDGRIEALRQMSFGADHTVGEAR